MKRYPLVCAAALVALAALGASAAQASGEKIAVFTKNNTNPYFQAVRLGADSAAKQMNASLTHYVPTKPDSIPEQMSQIEDVVVRKPDSIVFTAVDYKAMVPGVEKITRPASRSSTSSTACRAASSSPSSARTTTPSGSPPRATCSRRWVERATS
jgi:ABC-type sugar transport system substrate-binding protein